MSVQNLQGFLYVIVSGVVMMSCQVTDQELGKDLLPPDDNVYLFRDTIFDIRAYPVAGEPLVTSESRFDPRPDRVFLLGRFTDTIIGRAEAGLITQFNSSPGFRNGPDMEIDSLVLYLRIREYVGEMTGDLTLRLYELTERIYMDSTYYSDHTVEGGFSPAPLAEVTITPETNTTYPMHIRDGDYLNKWLDVATDTSVFTNDSIFKDYFRGFYITAEPHSDEGTMARVHLSNTETKLSIKYANDSTEVDTTAGRDFRWTNFAIDQFSTQKINIFRHDYTGTALEGLIGDEDADAPVTFVQGMGGVNTRLTFTGLEEWIDGQPVAIGSARLVFSVVPEETSGIMHDELPDRLILFSEPREGEFEPIFDELAKFQSNNNQFEGSALKAQSRGMFYDTTYIYSVDLSLHFQAMVDGEGRGNRFSLQLYSPTSDPRYSKIWSNLPDRNQRIRLEVVYLKL